MSAMSSLGIDWPELGYYLLGPIGLGFTLLLIAKSQLKNKPIFRHKGAGLVGLWTLGVALSTQLSPDHVSRFEEMMISALALILVLFIDWKVRPH